MYLAPLLTQDCAAETRHGSVAGRYAPGFEPVARQFVRHFDRGDEVGASLCVYHRGEMVVDLWGGWADTAQQTPWSADNLIVIFSASKGLASMALNLAAQRGAFDWDKPVAHYWSDFGQFGKHGITVRQLFNHRAGLGHIATPLTLRQLCDPTEATAVRKALEVQRPEWPADTDQGYHGVSWGLYASAFFEQVCREPMHTFLHREYLTPLGADVFMGTPPEQDHRVATLYPEPTASHLGKMAWAALRGGSTESKVGRSFISGGAARQTFMNPPTPGGIGVYNQPPLRRHHLAWASSTATARGLARAYIPWSVDGQWRGRRYVESQTIAPLLQRQGWSHCDRVLGKALGWAQGFLKESDGVFSPNTTSFGHPGMGGALGWCDPTAELAFAYTMNRCDWRIRSPRALALCKALYQCEMLQPI